MKLLFASGNAHKINEVRSLLPPFIELLTLQDVNFTGEIEEPYNSFEQNAHAKAAALFTLFQQPVFSEDSGLIVPALGGQPGVHSARYAGPQRSDKDNNALVIQRLSDKDRTAHFVTVICYIEKSGAVNYFEGKCAGTIAPTNNSGSGFGYDPIFIPNGFTKTFAHLGQEIKNTLSHRRIALDKLVAFLKRNPVK